MCYLYKTAKIKKEELKMKNEKLENQKIDENNLEKAAGGYTSSGTFTPYGSLTIDSLKLNEKEYEMLEKADCITHLEGQGEHVEYISRSKLKKALDILNKKSKFNDLDNNLDHELNIYF